MSRTTHARRLTLAAPLLVAWGCTPLLGDFSEQSTPSGADAASGDATTTEGSLPDVVAVETTTPEASSADGSAQDSTTGVPDAAACEAGLVSCSSGCVDTNQSAANCGGCGLDCGGGTCAMGHCSPVTITMNLATAPYGVAVGGGQVFWARSGAVEKCPVAGCTMSPATVYADSTLTNAGLTGGETLATDGNEVGWLAADPSTSSAGYPGPVIYTCPALGCLAGYAPKLGSSTTPMTQLYLVSGTLYANADCTGGSVKTCPLASCSGDPLTTALTGAECGFGMASDGATMFIDLGSDPQHGGVRSCPLSGCPSGGPTPMFQDGVVIALDATNVYASTSANTIVSCPKTGCGGSPTTIATNQPGILSMVTDAKNLYFTVQGSSSSATGELRACTLPSCAGGPTSLVTAQAQPVSMVAGGDGFLYWANAGLASEAATTSSIQRVRP